MPEVDLEPFFSLEAKHRRVSPLKSLLQYLNDDNVYLASGLPRVDSFPIKEVRYTIVDPSDPQTVLKGEVSSNENSKDEELDLNQFQQYGTGLGNPKLNSFYREFVEKLHLPKYESWEVIPSVGNTDGLYKCCLALLEVGQPILVAEWAYPTALETLQGLGVRILPIAIDEQGILPQSLAEVVNSWNAVNLDNRCKLVYTVPCGQNPTGATMSLQRRVEFYQVCQQLNLLILEDDPYYFLQLDPNCILVPELYTDPTQLLAKFGFSTLLPSLLSLDQDGRVIRLETFSKVLSPGLRSGFVVCQRKLAEKLRYFNEVTVQQPSGYSQLILTDLFTKTWKLAKLELHICQLRLQFQLRLNKVLEKLNQVNQPTKLFENNLPVAGMFIWIRPTFTKFKKYDQLYMDTLFDKLIQSKVVLVMGKYFDTKTFTQTEIDPSNLQASPYLRLCYTYADLDQVLLGIDRLVTTLKQLED